jgi:chromosome segregation ATPase
MHEATGPEVPQLEQRLRRVKGTMTWSLHSNYAQRLTEAHAHLKALNADIAVMNARYQEFVRARQAAVHSYEGYEDTIARLRTQSREALQTINQLMSRQGHLIETVAVAELKARQDRLVAYQTQARYAVADSYDRATKTQGSKPQAKEVSQ